MTVVHPLLEADVVAAVEGAASSHLGRAWTRTGFTDLNDRASHPCGIFHGPSLSVFVKLGVDVDAVDGFRSEVRGSALIRSLAGVPTPAPIGDGVVDVDRGALLLTEALSERPPAARTRDDWRAIGTTLATLHQVRGPQFGLDGLDGFFGPLRQDNRPVASDRWVDFYAERRVRPLLRATVDAGQLPASLARGLERLLQRLPSLCGPEPEPTLLHGDAQQNNFVSTDAGAVVADVAPFYGHPEIDLALLDYFHPVPDDVLVAYAERTPIESGFADRRPLWRVFVDLACISVDAVPWGPDAIVRLTDLVGRYL